MSCHGCAIKFSFFIKELSCPKCGFSFCRKCLKEKVINSDKSKKLCSTCFKNSPDNGSSKSVHPDEPPALLLKRLETLENPVRPPITIFKQKGKLSNLKVGLDPEDMEIMERLEKLKEGRKAKNPPSETEIKRRLMLLKGLNEDETEKPHSFKTLKKTEQEEVDDLLQQCVDEYNIQSRINEEGNLDVEDLESRLQKLHASPNSSQLEYSGKSHESEDDGDLITKRLVERAIAEGMLEKKLEESGTKYESDDDISMDSESEDSELLWCIICNEDATFKCFGCDGSLYCNSCYQQGHEYFEMEDHKRVRLSEASKRCNS